MQRGDFAGESDVDGGPSRSKSTRRDPPYVPPWDGEVLPLKETGKRLRIPNRAPIGPQRNVFFFF